MLVVSVPLTDSTRGLFGKEEFDVLYKASLVKANSHSPDTSSQESEKLPEGEGCIFVNIARGSIVQTDALITALKKGKLQGAALDVTDPEPLPEDSELWDLGNVIITPHVSGLFKEYLKRGFDVLTENLKRREKGETLLNEINRRKGYRSADT
jgi:phosphoglycerate dehydrogenase-like enzyme